MIIYFKCYCIDNNNYKTIEQSVKQPSPSIFKSLLSYILASDSNNSSVQSIQILSKNKQIQIETHDEPGWLNASASV